MERLSSDYSVFFVSCKEKMDTNILINISLFVVAATGVIISFINVSSFRKQVKIENTYKTLNYLRDHITHRHIENFKTLFAANNEIAGHKYNEFRFTDGTSDTIEYMFSEGGCGNEYMADVVSIFNMLAPTFRKVDFNIVWFEYGQIMGKVYGWTKYLEDKQVLPSNNLFYSDFNNFMKNKGNSIYLLNSKTYIYGE